jgi:hypothetical protein
MAFVFAYTLDGDVTSPVLDFAPNSGYTPKKGDVVKLNGSGEVIAGQAGASDTAVLGVCEGANFTGLVSGTPTVSTNNPGNLAKVRIDGACVYRIPLKAAASAPVVGTKYGTALVSGDFQLDTAVTTTGAIYRTVSYDANTRNVFVQIDSAARQIN